MHTSDGVAIYQTLTTSTPDLGATCLINLPSEIISIIFNHLLTDPLPGYVSKATLHRVCQVSRKLYRLAQPILYRHFIKPATDLDDQDDWGRPKLSKCNIRLFIRTLLENPSFAGWVKKLTINEWYNDNTEWKDKGVLRAVPPTSKLAHDMCKAAFNIPLTDAQRGKLLLELCQGSQDTDIALLLVLTPKVVTLELMLPFDPMLPHPDGLDTFVRPLEILRLACEAGSEGSNFPRIENVTCVPYADDEYLQCYLPYISIADIMQLPTVRRLEVSTLYEEHFVLSSWPSEPRTSSVQHLILRESMVPSTFLLALLGTCTALEIFEQDWDSNDGLYVSLSWDGYQEALSTQQTTLRSISIRGWHNSEQARMPRDHSSLSLEHFSRLRSLELHDYALVSRDEIDEDGNDDIDFSARLPNSLETLMIIDAGNRFMSGLEVLLAKAPAVLPNLKALTLGLHYEILLCDNDEEGHIFASIESAMAVAQHLDITWTWITVPRLHDRNQA